MKYYMQPWWFCFPLYFYISPCLNDSDHSWINLHINRENNFYELLKIETNLHYEKRLYNGWVVNADQESEIKRCSWYKMKTIESKECFQILSWFFQQQELQFL